MSDPRDELSAWRKRRNLLWFLSLPRERKAEELREMIRTGISWRDPQWKPKHGTVK